MHTVNRPAEAPDALLDLADSGNGNFGPLAPSLDAVFDGVCAYCERKVGDDELPRTRYHTCDHFVPRHLLCHPKGRQCDDNPPPHAPDCPIYDWDNLVYACRSCADAKGGQWPRPGDSATSYINPAGNPDASGAPESVFTYEIGTGEILVRDGISGVERNNAQRTIDDLALNYKRGPRYQNTDYESKGRQINLAINRQTWVEGLRHTLSGIPAGNEEALRFVIGEHIHPSSRFSSICGQFIRESEYRQHLPQATQSATLG